MSIRIELLKKVDVSSPDPSKTYKQMVVTYLNLTNGKPEGKKLVDFRSMAVWSILFAANPNDVFEVETAKNAAGYWEWTGITKSDKTTNDSAPQTVTSPTTSAPRSPAAKPTERVGSWETPEERAMKQIYIVRQSSISNAIEVLRTHGESIDQLEMFALAKDIENYVFGGLKDLVTDDQPE